MNTHERLIAIQNTLGGLSLLTMIVAGLLLVLVLLLTIGAVRRQGRYEAVIVALNRIELELRLVRGWSESARVHSKEAHIAAVEVPEKTAEIIVPQVLRSS